MSDKPHFSKNADANQTKDSSSQLNQKIPDKWKVLSTREIFDAGFIRVRSDRCLVPGRGEMPNYFVIEFTDWVQITAVTSDGQMVLVDQYRHAQGRRFLEVPGGATHPRKDVDPQEAAIRELIEETGYEPGRVVKAATHAPNPALQSNLLHIYVAFDCVKKHELQLDPFEDLFAVTKPIKEVYQMMEKGEINHALTVATLAVCRPHLSKWL